jgi:integrase
MRGSTYYAQYYLGSRQKRVCLRTESLQVAKEKMRALESRLAQDGTTGLPTRTPIAEVLTAYVQHIRTVKTAKSAQTDAYYLREAFGPVCDALRITSRKVTEASRKRCLTAEGKRERTVAPIDAACFEQVTTAQVGDWIAAKVRSRGLQPKTANRYREIMHRLYQWAAEQRGLQLPGDRNPVGRVERYKERAPEIEFLTLAQIDEQMNELREDRRLHAAVAVLIYAGLRREEALWLTMDDMDFKSGANGMIRVRAKTIGGEAWQPKTKVNRAVPISRTLRGYLDAYAPPKSLYGWYFPGVLGNRWEPDNFSRDLRRENDKAGLRWACLHYRHTFGSQLAQKGESLFKIATLMGNSPEICRRHYAALVPEAMGGSVEFGQRTT